MLWNRFERENEAWVGGCFVGESEGCLHVGKVFLCWVVLLLVTTGVCLARAEHRSSMDNEQEEKNLVTRTKVCFLWQGRS